EPAGKRHLEFSGIPVAAYEGGELRPDQVLVAGPGSSPLLTQNRRALAKFVNGGGHMLALGPDEGNSFLPLPGGTEKDEHIAAFFEPPIRDSLLAGIGPADVHNRSPRKLPLVVYGATVVGDGILAQSQGMNVVFFQFAPYSLTSAEGAVASF